VKKEIRIEKPSSLRKTEVVGIVGERELADRIKE
jgi:hypothetical protein